MKLKNINQSSLFNKSEIEKIKLLIKKWSNAEEIFVDEGWDIAIPQKRKSMYSAVTDLKSLSDLVVPKLYEYGFTSLPGDTMFIQYNKGDYFEEHKDVVYKENNDDIRVYTFIIQLSDENDYKGGTLLVEGNPMSKKIGNSILFKSNLSHELLEVSEGKREILVSMFTKKEMKNDTNRNFI
jgi:predicted 2-oxoglutarate/Fe(II)-dependent dioxygenase YbiX